MKSSRSSCWIRLMFVAAGTALMSPASACAEAFSDHDAKLYTQAIELDANADAPFPAVIPNAYHSMFGAQVHPSCFEYAAAHGLNRDQAERGIENTFLAAFEAVTSCQTKYPELQPYLSQWVHLFRRARFSCLHDSQFKRGFGAENVANALFLQAETNAHERSGIQVESEFSPIEAGPVVLVPRDVFAGLVTGEFGAGGADTIIHEILHSTDANNRWDHNQVEFHKPGAGGKCATDNITADRINVVSTLCSGAHLSGGADDTPQILFKRMSDCGARSCESFFSRDFYESNLANTLGRPWTPAQGLGAKAAGSLCSRIYDEGQCHYDLAASGGEVLQGDKKLKELGQRMRARLNAIFVPSATRLDPEVLGAAPDARDAFLAERGGACFKSVFQVSTKGAIFVPTGPVVVSPNHAGPAQPSTPDLVLKRAVAAMLEAVRRSPACAGEGGPSARKLSAALRGVAAKVQPAFEHRAYLDMIERRYLGEAERIPRPDESLAANTLLRAFVGPPLYDHYLAEVEPRHWASESLDCAKLGYSPEGRLYGGFKVLENAASIPRQCAR